MLDVPISEEAQSNKAEIVKHKQQLFGMFGGDKQKVSFEADKSLIDKLVRFLLCNKASGSDRVHQYVYLGDVEFAILSRSPRKWLRGCSP